jgi:hypothetical protein
VSKPIRRVLSFLLVLQLIIPYSTFAAAVGEFTSVVGDVTQTRAKEVITPVVKSPVEMKDLIATARTSSATMAFSDDSTITLAENTKLEIKEFLFKDQSRRGIFSLAIGKLTADVKKYIGGDNVFEIHSPSVGVGVRGTGFEFVEALKDGNVASNVENQRMATVTCTDGSLNLSAFSDTGAVVSTAVLEAGQVAVIIGGIITISAIGAVAAAAAIAKTAETGAAGAAGGAGTGTGGAAAAGGAAATTGLSTAAIAGIAIGGAAVVGGVAAAAGGGGGGGSSGGGGGGSTASVVSGTWRGMGYAPQTGSVPTTLILSQSDNRVSGTWDGATVTGTVSGNQLTLTFTPFTQSGVSFTGGGSATVTGNSMSGTMSMTG